MTRLQAVPRVRSGREEGRLVGSHRRSVGSVGLVVALAGLLAGAPVAAAGNTLRVEPSTATLPVGELVDIRLVQNAEVPTSGVQATVEFDPNLLQLEAIDLGAAYASAMLFVAADKGSI